jgi:hypothetical protein
MYVIPITHLHANSLSEKVSRVLKHIQSVEDAEDADFVATGATDSLYWTDDTFEHAMSPTVSPFSFAYSSYLILLKPGI